MNIIVCIDKNNGMSFNNRRQSQDAVLRGKVMELCSGATLHMTPYSFKQFAEATANIEVSEDIWNCVVDNDFCFIEDVAGLQIDLVDTLYAFNWNRKYPADVTFPMDEFNKAGFQAVSEEEFAGSSHEKITLKIYKRG